MPLFSPLTVALVAGGVARHRRGGCGFRADVRGDRVLGDRAAAIATGPSSVTVAFPFPAVAVTPVGAEGAVGAVGVTALDGSEAGPGADRLDAVTVKV